MISVSIADAMTAPATTVEADLTTAEAAGKMKADGIGALLVVGEDGLNGIVTESDLLSLVARNTNMEAKTVGDCMTTPVVTVESDTSTVDTGEMMKERSIRRLPVTEEGELVGIVTTTDLAYYLPRLRTTIRRERADPPRQ